MAKALEPRVSAPGDPEPRKEIPSTDPTANDGSSGSTEDEDLQRARILAHSVSVSAPPAAPSMIDEIETDITSKDVSEHAPGLYVARSWIRPRGLTSEEIGDIVLRLQVDLTLALSRIRAKSYRKRRNEDMVMIDMRMAGTPARGSTKVTLRPCIWIFCGSKWCQKIVERDVKALNWLVSHKVHFVRKGGPLLSADEQRDLSEEVNHSDEEMSDAESSCASSAPSVTSHHMDVDHTVNGQAAPIQSNDLPCELKNLTGCNVVFLGDDEDGWMAHVERHLGGRFPSKLRCWFCNDSYFDAHHTSGGDLRFNFILRMQHIRHHLVHRGSQPGQMLRDGHIIQHLFDHNLIDSRTYDCTLDPTRTSPVPSDQGHHRSHRSHQQVEEEVDPSRRNSQHRIHHRPNHGKTQKRSRSPKPPNRNSSNQDSDYEPSLASLSLDDYDPHVTRTDYYGSSYASTSSLFTDRAFNGHDQHFRPESHSTEFHGNNIALWKSAELRLQVRLHLLTSLIGLSCISSTWRDHAELSRSNSKMGGAVSIKHAGQTLLYGMTSGHGLIYQLLNVAPQSGDDPSIDGCSDDTDSDSEDEQEPPIPIAESVEASKSVDSAVDLNDYLEWRPIDYGITADFLGIGVGPNSERVSQPDKLHVEDALSGDLALFPIGSFHRPGLTNRYLAPTSLEAREVTSIAENEFESIVPVVILLGPEQTVSGSLQPGRVHFSIRGTAIDVRQVRLSRDLAPGSSGSWVVHDQTLYGMIVAVFPGECMALMVPSKRMISDIQKLLPGATDISVAIRQ